MKVLLDTHSFLWFIDDNPKLSDFARSTIENGDNQVLMGIASLWEIAIKYQLGKLKLSNPFDTLFPAQLQLNDIQLLKIEVAHLSIVAQLPMHHRDPFDRLIIAQAIAEKLPIVGTDSVFDAYAIRRIW
ncbi:MAG: type II toxin-antitoxin system VapC family toxin [Cyanobacteria bacterium J06635_1]